eukprot:3713-Heterococcus_DN1.PRE.1
MAVLTKKRGKYYAAAAAAAALWHPCSQEHITARTLVEALSHPAVPFTLQQRRCAVCHVKVSCSTLEDRQPQDKRTILVALVDAVQGSATLTAHCSVVLLTVAALSAVLAEQFAADAATASAGQAQ